MSNQVQVSIPSIGNEHEVAARGYLELAKSYEIDCQELAELAAEDLRHIKAKYKQVDEVRKSMVKPLDEARKCIQDFFRQPLEWLEQSEDVLKKAIARYVSDQEKRRLEMEAAQRKLAAEIAAKAQAEAAEAAAQGDHETALAKTVEAQVAAAPIVAPPVQKLDGISFPKKWTFEITSLDELIVAAAADPSLRPLLMANEKEIRKRVEALKEHAKIPGVATKEDIIVSARAA